MSTGETLRRERARQGRELAEIAHELRITQRYLRAIEEDEGESLPNSFFYKAFVRQYATTLGLDANELVHQLESISAAEALPLPGADPRFPVRKQDPIVEQENRRYFSGGRLGWSMAGLALVLVGCAGIYAAWYPRPGEPQRVVAESPPPPAPPVQPVVETVAPPALNHIGLSLSATEKTWLSITSDGKQVFAGVLEPSQSKTLEGLEVARLKVGNAGGIEVLWNGKPIGPIGPRGQVRIVKFTRDNFQILSPSEL